MKTKEDIHKKGKIVRMKLLGVDPVSGIIREDAQYKMKQHIIHSKIARILYRQIIFIKIQISKSFNKHRK